MLRDRSDHFKSDRYYVRKQAEYDDMLFNMYDSYGDGIVVATFSYSGRYIYIADECEITGGLFRGGDFYGGTIHGGKFTHCSIHDGIFHDGNFHGGEYFGGEYFDGEFDSGHFYNGAFHGGVFSGVSLLNNAATDTIQLLEIFGGTFEYGVCPHQILTRGSIFSGKFINAERQ